MRELYWIFLFVLIIQVNCAFFKKFILQDKQAICLDGSPGIYYFYEGKNPNKFIISFEGGGWCGGKTEDETIQNCYQRSLTYLGSTKDVEQNFTKYQGILSDDPKNSFADYSKAFFKYCDGSGYQGSRQQPVQYKGTKLYFRGNNITVSALNHMQKMFGLFSKSTEIMLTGYSAGGMATFTWANYIKDRSSHGNVYIVPDSGIFLDSPNFHTKEYQYRKWFQNLFKYSNVNFDPPIPDCVKAYQQQPYKCMMVQYLFPYIKSRIFAIQSLYDSWSIYHILGIYCAQRQPMSKCSQEQRQYLEQYHKNTSILLQRMGNKQGNGYWAPVCVNHGYLEFYDNPQYSIPMLSNNTIHFAVSNWVFNKTRNHKYMDTGAWPDNQPCAYSNPNLLNYKVTQLVILCVAVLFINMIRIYLFKQLLSKKQNHK